MLHHKIAVLVIMTVSLFAAKAEAQSSQLDRVPAIASSSSNPSQSLARVKPAPGMEMMAGGSSSSSSSFSGGVYLTPADRPKRTKKLGDGRGMRPFSTVAVGFKADSLGAGVEVATPLARTLNLRTTVNIFSFGCGFDIDGVNYNAKLNFHSGQVNLDWFPMHGEFHISPGLIYFNNQLSADISVPPGASFELGNPAFTNSVTDPLHGTAAITYGKKVAPALMVGFGNIIPRSGRHFSMPFEFGVAYMGAAQINIQLAGTACHGEDCFDVAANPDAQQSLHSEINDLNSDLKNFQLYPILSLGMAYRF